MTFLTAAVVGLFTAQVALLVTTIFLHRTLSHRSMTLSPAVTVAVRVLTWVMTGIRPRQWVAVHRKHHAFTDVEGDPHSPVLLGWVRVQLGNVGLYRAVANDDAQVARYARDLPADRWDRLLFDRAWIGLGIGFVVLAAVLGPLPALVAAAVHTGAYLGLNAAVNAVTHTFGRRPLPNTATNLQWLALLTCGEGLHNNHHGAPTSAKLAFRPGEIDPAWWVISGLRRLGWATVRHDRPKLKEPATAA